jgi:hydroxyacylglutathione hydrolase
VALQFRIIPVTAFEQNCSLIWCDESMDGALVDPGGDIAKIQAAVNAAGVTIRKILLTHAHIDHAGATRDVADLYQAPIIGPHVEDLFWIEALPAQSQMFGFPAAKAFIPDRWLQQGDTVELGKLVLEVIHTPGHTPGHVVFFERGARLAFVGDVIFQGSIGRTDFPKGDYKTLVHSIREKLFPLGDDVAFVPGHGDMSTFGDERRSNPFVADHRFG